MHEHEMVRGLLLRVGRGLPATSKLAEALREWALPHREWLCGAGAAEDEPDWAALLDAVATAERPDAPRAHPLILADELAGLLGLHDFDRALLGVMLAADRLPRLSGLATIVARHGLDLPGLLGELAGAAPSVAASAVRRSAVLRLGLIGFAVDRAAAVTVDVRWPLERLLQREPESAEALVEALIGPRQGTALTLDDFGHVAEAGFLVRLLRGALATGAEGINILLHGPPGTGKTEFARTLAQAAGAALFAVGEADCDGEEPTRTERVAALRLGQRLFRRRGDALLLFDEMEDLIGDAKPSSDDWLDGREGSKVFVNRMLENNAVPVIWTTNAVGNIDDAILRRMSFVLPFEWPTRRAAQGMLARIAAEVGVAPGADLMTLLDRAPETASVLRVAARAGQLAGEADGGALSARALVRALRGGDLPWEGAEAIDLDLFETDRPIADLLDGLQQGGADVSLLLSGPPGTGKTAFAHHMARALDRPLLVKRASDLLSKWVGGTERHIAAAFAEARRDGAVLLLDEADSLLFDRRTARTSWEVSQVNELLTWLDRHPLPVVAATNHPGGLDPATLRRFVFKLALRPLGPRLAARAFARFFGMAAPAALADLRNLTPGDFALVARQLRHAPARDAGELVARLREESAAKPSGSGQMGF